MFEIIKHRIQTALFEREGWSSEDYAVQYHKYESVAREIADQIIEELVWPLDDAVDASLRAYYEDDTEPEEGFPQRDKDRMRRAIDAFLEFEH